MTERQLSENKGFPFPRKEWVVVQWGRRWSCGGEGGEGYADIICKFCTRKVNILPFVNAKMLWVTSPNSIKYVQLICIINSIMDCYFNT